MGLSDGCGAGYGFTTSTYQEYVGNGATLAFKLTNNASDVTLVQNWVGGTTNAFATKTKTTHYTYDAPTNDFVTVTYVAGNAPIASVKEKWTVTFPALAGATAGDFFYMDDYTGARWGISLDTTGSSEAPTSALWTAIAAGKKAHIDISGATTATQVAAAVELVFDALTGVTTKLVTDDTAADGTMTFEIYTAGDYSGSNGVKNADGSDAGSITKARTTYGKTNTCRITHSQSAHPMQNGCTDGM